MTKHPSVVRPGDPEPPVGTVLALKRLWFYRCYEPDGEENWCTSQSHENWMTWEAVCADFITEAKRRRLIRSAAASVVKWGTA